MIEFIKIFLEFNLKTISHLFGFVDSLFFSKIELWLEKKLLAKAQNWNISSIRLVAALSYFTVAALVSTSILLLLTGSGMLLGLNPGLFMVLYLSYFAASAGAFIWAIRAFNKFKIKLPNTKMHWLEEGVFYTLKILGYPLKTLHNSITMGLINKVKDWGPTAVKATGTLFFWLEEFLIIESVFVVLGTIFAPSVSVIAPLTFAGLILSFTPGFITSISAFALISEGLGAYKSDFSADVTREAQRLKQENLKNKLLQHENELKSSKVEPDSIAKTAIKTLFSPAPLLNRAKSDFPPMSDTNESRLPLRKQRSMSNQY